MIEIVSMTRSASSSDVKQAKAFHGHRPFYCAQIQLTSSDMTEMIILARAGQVLPHKQAQLAREKKRPSRAEAE